LDGVKAKKKTFVLRQVE